MTTYLWIANQKAILSPGANPHPLTFTFVELQNEYQMWRQHLVSVTNSLFFSESHMGAPCIAISCDRNPQNTCFWQMTEIYLVVGKKRLFLRTRNFSISLTMSRFIRMRSRNLALEESGLISFDLVLTKVYTGVSFVNGIENPLCQFVNYLRLPTNDRCAFERKKPTHVSFAFIPTYVPPCKTHIFPFFSHMLQNASYFLANYQLSPNYQYSQL